MSNPTSKRRSGLVGLAGLCLMLFTSALGAQDLTGYWRDDNDALYRMRRLGDRLYWSMQGCPRVINVFTGTIAGDIVTGEWADLPGGQLQGSGTIALVIESGDQLLKIGQNGNYGATRWTRISGEGIPCEGISTSGGGAGGIGQGGGVGQGGTGQGGGLGTEGEGFRCGLGRHIVVQWQPGNDWTIHYTRRGDSNEFLGYTWTGAGSYNTSAVFRISGNLLIAESIEGGMPTRLEAKIGKDGVSFSGHMWFRNSPDSRIAANGVIYCGDPPGGWRGPANPGAPVGAKLPTPPGGGTGSYGPNSTGKQICANPLALQLMDEWLGRAEPPKKHSDDRLHYEEWGRIVGITRSAVLTVNGPPTTHLTRCEYLWFHAPILMSSNGIGTLQEYVLARL